MTIESPESINLDSYSGIQLWLKGSECRRGVVERSLCKFVTEDWANACWWSPRPLPGRRGRKGLLGKLLLVSDYFFKKIGFFLALRVFFLCRFLVIRLVETVRMAPLTFQKKWAPLKSYWIMAGCAVISIGSLLINLIFPSGRSIKAVTNSGCWGRGKRPWDEGRFPSWSYSVLIGVFP